MSKQSSSGKGLQHAKAWVIELSRCKRVKPLAKVLGSVIREHFNTSTGKVYVGSEKLAELTGWYERDVKARRSMLRDTGWLVDTGEREGRAIVWKLTIPDCGCGQHGAPVEVTTEPEPLTPEEEAEILAEVYEQPEPATVAPPVQRATFTDEPDF